jgi:hypothetical protein
MFDPMPPKRRVSLTEILTIDDLINLVSSKAHTRRGRVVTGASALVLLGAIIVAPVLIRSNQSAGPSSTPTIPVVTVPKNTNPRTAFVTPLVREDTKLNTIGRLGPKPESSTPATPAPKATTPPPTTAPPVTAPPPVQYSAPPAPAPTYPQVTYPPPPPVTTPQTAPPLTTPPDGTIFTPGR